MSTATSGTAWFSTTSTCAPFFRLRSAGTGGENAGSLGSGSGFFARNASSGVVATGAGADAAGGGRRRSRADTGGGAASGAHAREGERGQRREGDQRQDATHGYLLPFGAAPAELRRRAGCRG